MWLLIAKEKRKSRIYSDGFGGEEIKKVSSLSYTLATLVVYRVHVK